MDIVIIKINVVVTAWLDIGVFVAAYDIIDSDTGVAKRNIGATVEEVISGVVAKKHGQYIHWSLMSPKF